MMKSSEGVQQSRNRLDAEIGAWKQKVEARLSRVFKYYPRELPLGEKSVRRAVDLLKDFTLRAASKRVRAYLVKVGFIATGEHERPALIDVAAAVELIQTYLLVHDDIIDRDETRRGGPTVHAALRRTLSGPYSDRQRVSNDLALLLGDLAFSWAIRLVVESDWPSERRIRALTALLRTHETCVGGQYLDVQPRDRNSLTREHVISIAQRKTASYTFVGPLTAGAYLGGANAATIDALSRYGVSVGTAYQWIDDLDDIMALRSGAARSNDLDEGKVTAIVLATRKSLKSSDRKVFDQLILKPRRSESELSRLQKYVERADVESIVRAEAGHFIKKGLSSLKRSRTIGPKARQCLIELGRYILGLRTE